MVLTLSITQFFITMSYLLIKKTKQAIVNFLKIYSSEFTFPHISWYQNW